MDSTGQCNKLVESFSRHFVFQCLSWTFVQPSGHRIELCLRVNRYIQAFEEVLPQQAIRVFVASALSGTSGIAEVDADVGGQCEALVVCHLFTPIPSQLLVKSLGQFVGVFDQRVDHRFRVVAGNLHQHYVACLALHQGG